MPSHVSNSFVPRLRAAESTPSERCVRTMVGNICPTPFLLSFHPPAYFMNRAPPHSPELNGVAERTNRTIHNLVRCALLQASLPKSFWADALRHSFFAHNSFPCTTPAGFSSPMSILGSDPVPLDYLHPFGCLAWYKVPKADRQKLNPKACSSILLLYLSNGNGYRLWDLKKRTVVEIPWPACSPPAPSVLADPPPKALLLRMNPPPLTFPSEGMWTVVSRLPFTNPPTILEAQKLSHRGPIP